MNIVVWNCRGALSPSFQSFFHDMAQIHSLAIMIITETKISGQRAKDILDKLPFDRAIHANNIGFTEGLWVLWDTTQVDVSLSSHRQSKRFTLW